MPKKSNTKSSLLRFSLKPVGPSRSEQQIKEDVKAALDEAVENFKKQASQKNLSAKAEPEGAFLGVAVVSIWLLKTIGTAVVTGAAGAAGKRLFDYFADSLRARNLDPGPASEASTGKSEGKEKSKSSIKSKKGEKK
jgi:hypothetical protein